MPPADDVGAEPERRATRVAAYASCSTDQARWFTRDEAVALPLVELAAEALRIGFDADS